MHGLIQNCIPTLALCCRYAYLCFADGETDMLKVRGGNWGIVFPEPTDSDVSVPSTTHMVFLACDLL